MIRLSIGRLEMKLGTQVRKLFMFLSLLLFVRVVFFFNEEIRDFYGLFQFIPVSG